jgi:microcystin-dependent protein
MPTGPRIRGNNAYGVTTDNPLASGALVFNSTQLQLLPSVTAAHAVIVLDPKRVNGEPEIVIVTSHVGLATSATIVRAAYGTVARSHPVGTAWAHVTVDEDYTKILTSITRPLDPYMGQTVFETDTLSHRYYDGASWNSSPPIGTLLPYLGSVAPTGYLMADGTPKSRTGATAALYGVIGTTYGVGDGVNTFNLPNLNGKVPVGQDSAQAEFDVLGEIGGAKTVTITQAQMPVHLHGITDIQHNHGQTNHVHGNDQHDHGVNSWSDPVGDHNHAGANGYVYVVSIGGVQNDYLVNNTAANRSSSVTYTDVHSAGGHSHPVGTDVWPAGINILGNTANLQTALTGINGTNNAGSGNAVNNLQPYIVVNYIVKY